jgi:Protein of unknwon function (DUF3008)
MPLSASAEYLPNNRYVAMTTSPVSGGTWPEDYSPARNGSHGRAFRAQQGENAMPARSKKQQMAAGAALAAKRGERPVSSLKGASRQMAQSMNEKQLEEFAHTKRKGLPRKKG